MWVDLIFILKLTLGMRGIFKQIFIAYEGPLHVVHVWDRMHVEVRR